MKNDLTKPVEKMKNKKAVHKKDPSAAKYLTFSKLEENSVIRNFRITANLQDAGKVTAEIAKANAENKFEKYRIIQDRVFESDFDREVKKMLEGRSKKFGGGDE